LLRWFHRLRPNASDTIQGLHQTNRKTATARSSVPTVLPRGNRGSVPAVTGGNGGRESPAKSHQAEIAPDIADKRALLVRKSWGPRDDNQAGDFVLDARSVPSGGAEIFVSTLLKHVRRAAPRLHVPFMIPRIEISEIESACGQFIENDGWVKLVLSTKFAARPSASRAILCHELCHYILFANGIWLPDRAENERLTDVAMFIFGMGDIFLAGFRSDDVAFNRRGHRIGYLTDAEYRFLSIEVTRLRATGELQSVREDELRRHLLNRLLGNEPMLQRYLAHARQRFPALSEADRIQALLDDFDRGR
jgi:hypothetical protein